jgi:hypothetical protein
MPVLTTARVTVSVAAALAAFGKTALGAPAGADDLVAHHATYALSLAPGNANSSITGADGVMTYDLKDTCDGWATDLKMKVIIAFDSGDARTFESSQVTWEAKSGKAYRFTIKNDAGGDQTTQLRGEARIDSKGNASVIADLPMQAEAKLPSDTIFPMGQTAMLLHKAASGESFFTANVFDGTTATQVMQESAAVGAGSKDWAFGDKFPELKDVLSYPVDLAFFLTQGTDGTPDTEQQIRLYANGISGEIDFDLGGVKIRALLDRLKLQPAPGC